MAIWIPLFGFLFLLLIDLLFLIILTKGYGILIVVLIQSIFCFYGFYRIRKMDLNLFLFIELKIKTGEVIIREVWEESIVLLSLIFLMIPGFLTDITGTILLISQFRKDILDLIYDRFLSEKSE